MTESELGCIYISVAKGVVTKLFSLKGCHKFQKTGFIKQQ